MPEQEESETTIRSARQFGSWSNCVKGGTTHGGSRVQWLLKPRHRSALSNKTVRVVEAGCFAQQLFLLLQQFALAKRF